MSRISISDIESIIPFLTTEERLELQQLMLSDNSVWSPLPGPQTEAFNSPANTIGYGGAAGGGKETPLYVRILTATGWTTMGDIRPGDMVFDEEGKPCTVVAKSEVETRSAHRLTFSDGSQIDAGDTHQWITRTLNERTRRLRSTPEFLAKRRAARPSRAGNLTSAKFKAAIALRNSASAGSKNLPLRGVRTTQEIRDSIKVRGRLNHSIDVAGALQLPEQDLLLDPYVLGVWLGDGSPWGADISVSSLAGNVDTEIQNNIIAAGHDISLRKDGETYGVRQLLWRLRALNLLRNKHIPEPYLRASFAQRLALLQGLMDSDGHCDLRGQCEMLMVRKPLMEQIRELILSLGVKVAMREGVATLYGRVTGPKYRLKFMTDLPAFRLSRKLERQKREGFRGTHNVRYVEKVEPIGLHEVQCIQVDSPSRTYLIGDAMIPTHNSDLAVGLALCKHKRTAIFRREGTELTAIIDRVRELIGSSAGYNGSQKIWREPVPGVQLEFGSCPNLGDERKYQGRAKDLLVCDEATHFIQAQVLYLMGWVRTVVPGQLCQTLLTFNPPENMDAMWVEKFFAPWLGDKYPNPAPFGSLRWFATFKGKDFEVDGPEPFIHKGERLIPQSRTFIFSRVTDNPHLARSGYIAQLQAMPEPHRSRLLYGDFKAMRGENPLQTIPTRWVEEAMARWQPMSIRKPMTSMGVDVARGGKDATAIARRHDNWFDIPLKYPGKETPDGPITAGLVMGAWRDGCTIHIDSIGVGASPYDFLKQAGIPVVGVVANTSPTSTDKSGLMTFANMRTQLWWKMREELDPANGKLIALPNDDELKQDLCTPRWGMRGKTLHVESRDEIIKRLGRSPDLGTAYVQALIDTPTLKSLNLNATESKIRSRGHNPLDVLDT